MKQSASPRNRCMPPKSMLVSGPGGITFHPFAALICYFEESEYLSFTPGASAAGTAPEAGAEPGQPRFCEAQKKFAAICAKRRKSVSVGKHEDYMCRPLWLHA